LKSLTIHNQSCKLCNLQAMDQSLGCRSLQKKN
jgi:hypothetical protein